MRRGLTLVELILVVALATSVGMMTAPVYGRFLTQNAVEESAVIIGQNLRKAQYYALMSRKSADSGWGVQYQSNIEQEMTVYQGASYATRNPARDEKTKLPGTLAISDFELNFARVTGEPPGVLTINISGQGTSRTVSVNSLGTVSVSNP